jgi:hypothetical protein
MNGRVSNPSRFSRITSGSHRLSTVLTDSFGGFLQVLQTKDEFVEACREIEHKYFHTHFHLLNIHEYTCFATDSM